MSKPLAFGLFQLLWHFFTSGLAYFVNVHLVTLVMHFGKLTCALQFQVVFHQGQKFREIYKWCQLYCFHVRNVHISPFKSEVGCFKGVVVCILYLAFFGAIIWLSVFLTKDWSGLFCSWQPGNPGGSTVVTSYHNSLSVYLAGLWLTKDTLALEIFTQLYVSVTVKIMVSHDQVHLFGITSCSD